MSSCPDPLSHLFRAVYSDGTIFDQPHDDKPRIAETGSAFSDVRVSDLVRFELHQEDEPYNVYAVDLVTGRFGVNDVWHYPAEDFVPHHALKIIFWRICHQPMTCAGVVQEDLSVAQTEEWHAPRVVAYQLGWETLGPDGKNVKRTMTIEA